MKDDSLIKLIQIALSEDIPEEDITSQLCFDEDPIGVAQIVAKEDGIFYGESIINTIFEVSHTKVDITLTKKDGDALQTQDRIATIRGPIQTLLKTERTLLNFLQRLSGIATLTNQFKKKLNNPNIQILDTRKTTPAMRFLEKAAVIAGGGQNHRIGLSDMVLIKENHLKELENHGKLNTLDTRLKQFKEKNPRTQIEIEITNNKQLHTLDLSKADIVMLDNFDRKNIQDAITTCQTKYPHIQIEVSGNISLDTIGYYSDLEIHRISVGMLTHSPKALDLSMLFL